MAVLCCVAYSCSAIQRAMENAPHSPTARSSSHLLRVERPIKALWRQHPPRLRRRLHHQRHRLRLQGPQRHPPPDLLLLGLVQEPLQAHTHVSTTRRLRQAHQRRLRRRALQQRPHRLQLLQNLHSSTQHPPRHLSPTSCMIPVKATSARLPAQPFCLRNSSARRTWRTRARGTRLCVPTEPLDLPMAWASAATG